MKGERIRKRRKAAGPDGSRLGLLLDVPDAKALASGLSLLAMVLGEENVQEELLTHANPKVRALTAAVLAWSTGVETWNGLKEKPEETLVKGVMETKEVATELFTRLVGWLEAQPGVKPPPMPPSL